MSEELRFSKIDDAIQRLAIVSADLSKMLAVHEQRIGTQEKTSDGLIVSIEKRRSEVDQRFRDLQMDMQNEFKTMRESNARQHNEQNAKIESLQRYIWIGIGVISAISLAAPLIMNKILN